MEIRQLRSFLVLAHERHFGRAAARLHLAQPALSQQLKALERSVGTQLMQRSSRRVELTEAGRLLQSRAGEVVAAVDRTQADLTLLAAGRAGRVRLGFVGTATYDVLPQVTRRVREDLPDLELDLHGELLAPALVDRLREGHLDLAVLRPGLERPKDLVVEELRREPLVAVLPSHHPLAARDGVRLEELAGDTFLTHPAGRRSTMQPLVVQSLREAGVEPTLLEVGETGTLVAFAAAGLGVGLVPASVRALRLDGVKYVPLVGRPVTAPLALAHRPDPGPPVQSVATLVRSLVTQPSAR